MNCITLTVKFKDGAGAYLNGSILKICRLNTVQYYIREFIKMDKQNITVHNLYLQRFLIFMCHTQVASNAFCSCFFHSVLIAICLVWFLFTSHLNKHTYSMAEFLHLGAIGMWTWIIPCRWLSYTLWAVEMHPWPLTIWIQSYTHPIVTNKVSPGIAKCPPEEQNCPSEKLFI